MKSSPGTSAARALILGAVGGVLAYVLTGIIRPPATDTRLDDMQAEIDGLRARLDVVDALANEAGQIADDLRFDLEHSPASVIGGR